MAGGGDCGGSVSCGCEASVAGGGGVNGGGGSVHGGDSEPVPVWGNIRSGSRYVEEAYQRGEPDMRPYVGRVVLPRTAGMASRAAQFRGRALFATVMGDGLRVTPEALLGAIEVHCRIPQSAVSIEGLPEDAWEPQAVKLLIAALDGKLIEILPATDSWVLPVTAWLRDPCNVPKMLTLTVPASAFLPSKPGSDDDVESPSPPCSPKHMSTRDYPLILHVKEVIDRGDLLSEGLDPKQDRRQWSWCPWICLISFSYGHVTGVQYCHLAI